MSLSEINYGGLVKKQFLYKLRAYTGVFSSMLLLQVIAIFFSFSTYARSLGRFGVDVNIDYHSADIIIVFTMLWAFINTINIITKKYREDDFAFVTNRMSNNLSNILFLFFASIIGGITAILSVFLLRVISYFLMGNQSILGYDVLYSAQVFSGTLVTILYLFLFCSLGYIAGMLIQLHRTLVVVVPVLIVGLLITIGLSGSNVILHMIEFYAMETNALLFVCKTVITSILLFIGAIIISNRLEVRQ